MGALAGQGGTLSDTNNLLPQSIVTPPNLKILPIYYVFKPRADWEKSELLNFKDPSANSEHSTPDIPYT
jgi:hypothetical protein